ncbi:MAG: SDR family oxidoreductase [Roseibium sp.]|uniref:SDR family NAD(P)-dependent oxidoreductase n=1 Tax=Roseibium sp. TaxID=1936156 RepID=UPI003D9C2B44
MTRTLDGKSALVTGASRGIGAVIARRLAADGAHVTLTYASSSGAADAVVTEIKNSGGQARAIAADARQSGASANAVADTVAHQGGLDILVSNAGINISKPIEHLSDDDYEAVFDINVRASFEIIRAASAQMRPGGRIVAVTATIANSYFAPGLALYGASKAAVNGLVQGWSRDLGPKGIAINAIVPGPIDTDMNPDGTELSGFLKSQVPLGRYGRSEEIAALAAFLVGPEAGFITGSRIIIDGGLTA